MSRAEDCVERMHMHVGVCQRAGYANGVQDGYANGIQDAEEKAAALTPMQALLIRLDPIVHAYAESCSPCGDPMGIEWFAETYRLSDVGTDPEQWSTAIRKEMERLGWFLA